VVSFLAIHAVVDVQYMKFVTLPHPQCCILIDRGILYTCGEGRHGKLCSDEDNNNYAVPVKVTRFKGFTVQKVCMCG
jgi:hypothetical protein